LCLVIFVLMNAYFYRFSCFADVASATITWDAIYTLLRLLGNPNRSSVHQRPSECMFSFENSPDIETGSNASEFLGDTLNMLDNDTVLLYCAWKRAVTSRWIHYGGNEFLWAFIKQQIVSDVLNLVVQILLVLTHGLGSSDQTMNDSPFYVVWLLGLEVYI
jgi:hypothetical protein